MLTVALARRADLHDAAIHLAHVHRLKGRPEQSLAAYEQALVAAPRHTTALLEAAQMAFEMGLSERALAYAERALATGNVPAADVARVKATITHLQQQLGLPPDG